MKDNINYDSEGRLRCEICGKYYHHLGAHLKKHNILVKEYNEEFGNPKNRALVSDKVKAVQRTNAFRRGLDVLCIEYGKKSPFQKGKVYHKKHKK